MFSAPVTDILILQTLTHAFNLMTVSSPAVELLTETKLHSLHLVFLQVQDPCKDQMQQANKNKSYNKILQNLFTDLGTLGYFLCLMV